MKASDSPCTLDNISTPFKLFPFLRSYITAVCNAIWVSVNPRGKQKGMYGTNTQRGDTSDPAYFRPTTLESILLKIFTSCLHDSMFAFLKANGFIEHKIQKDVLPQLTGPV